MGFGLGQGEGERSTSGYIGNTGPLLKGTEELPLLVTRILFAANIDLLIILGHLAAFAHALHT